MKFSTLMTAALALTFCGASQAATLLSMVDLPNQIDTPYSLLFTAGATTTDVSFGGYNLPSYVLTKGISLLDTTTASGNLLALTWAFTPAPSGSLGDQYDDGFGTGTNGLSFGGTTVDSFDVFSQSITTVTGHNYALNFLLSNSSGEGSGIPNALVISASDAIVGTPEPASMMLLGLGLCGFAVLARRKGGR